MISQKKVGVALKGVALKGVTLKDLTLKGVALLGMDQNYLGANNYHEM